MEPYCARFGACPTKDAVWHRAQRQLEPGIVRERRRWQRRRKRLHRNVKLTVRRGLTLEVQCGEENEGPNAPSSHSRRR